MAHENPLTLQERVALIQKQPVFEHWPDPILYELAQKSDEMLFEVGSNIVKEGELVDRIYLLIDGRAEVCNFVIRGEGMYREVIATLGPGESIGLAESNLFSRSGVRTATVTCLSDQRTITFSVDTLNEILKAHPELNQQMHAATEMVVRMNFIKQLNPFQTMLPEDLRWLANQVEEIHVPKDTVIFHQGEKGEHCYFIKSGVVRVTVEDNKGVQELARLGEKQIFGEVSLMLESVRNATVTTLMDCVLFRITTTQLDRLSQYDDDAFKTMMGLVMERSRPNRVEGVEISARVQESGERQYILKNIKNNHYFELSETGLLIWGLINGSTSMREIVRKARTRKEELSQNTIEKLVFRLVSAGFVEVKGFNLNPSDGEQDAITQTSNWFKRLVERNITFSNCDHRLSGMYRNLLHIFYTTVGGILIAVLIAVGTFKFIRLTEVFATYIFQLPAQKILLAFVLTNIVSIFALSFHEFCHALTTKHFGYKVRAFGMGWYHWGPIAFCDTSDAWAAPPRERKWINVSGIVGDLILASIFAIVATFISNDYIQLILWLLIIRNLISVMVSFNVLVERDGYYVLSDLLAEPHLREAAMPWFDKKSDKKINSKVKIYYWLWFIVWLFLLAGFGWFVQHFILAPNFAIFSHHAWNWLGFIVMLIFGLANLVFRITYYKTE